MTMNFPNGGRTITSGKAGRKKGVPNVTTRKSREAIARFVDGNVHRLQKWLDMVAEGVQGVREDRKTGQLGIPTIPPNPAKAFELFQSIVEYHVPKLARIENTGLDGTPLMNKVEVVFVSAQGPTTVVHEHEAPKAVTEQVVETAPVVNTPVAQPVFAEPTESKT